MMCASVAEGDDKLQVGKVVLLEDEENGGVKTRTFVNATFRKCACSAFRKKCFAKYLGIS